MDGAEFPPCWLFGLRRPNTGAYLGSLMGLMAHSRGAHAKEYFPELLLPVFLSPRWATATPRLCRRPSNTSRYVWFSLPWGYCSFPWVPMHTVLCVCPPRVESLFPPVLSKSCSQIPLTFKVWFSRNFSSRCRSPRLGCLTWGSEPSLQWVNFCSISVCQSVSHPPTSYGIWFYCDCTPPAFALWLLLCLWMWGIFVGEFQCLPVDDCSAASCDSGVLTRGSESTSFYSTILGFSFIWPCLSLFSSCFLDVSTLIFWLRAKQGSILSLKYCGRFYNCPLEFWVWLFILLYYTAPDFGGDCHLFVAGSSLK